jgi:hypothetical protein
MHDVRRSVEGHRNRWETIQIIVGAQSGVRNGQVAVAIYFSHIYSSLRIVDIPIIIKYYFSIFFESSTVH